MKTIKTFSLAVTNLALVFSGFSVAITADANAQEVKQRQAVAAAAKRYRGCEHISSTKCKKLFIDEETYQQVI